MFSPGGVWRKVLFKLKPGHTKLSNSCPFLSEISVKYSCQVFTVDRG